MKVRRFEYQMVIKGGRVMVETTRLHVYGGLNPDLNQVVPDVDRVRVFLVCSHTLRLSEERLAYGDGSGLGNQADCREAIQTKRV